ncbi:MAG: UTP--glucose-1-phosphate uridylyltransferase [Candidatus Aminicenantes bacterium]|nr:UTP--glucose-1-phosphate uridylyltransferase [Candidatus Aminicenantes bacterium]
MVQKALIPAAGYATRSLPATKAVPKEMLPLVDKPMIQYAVEEAVASGIKEVGIVTAAWKTAIGRHFGPNPELEAFLEKKGKGELLESVKKVERLAEFAFILQPEQRGLGHAISMGEEFAGGKPLAVLNPDTIYDGRVPCLRQLIDVFEEKRATTVVLGKIDREGTKKYGVVRAEKVSERVYRILDLIEKPGPEKAPSDMAVLGRYVFTTGIFDALRNTGPGYGGEIQITDAIGLLLKTESVYGVLFEGRHFDAGGNRGFLEATIHFARKRPDLSSLF